MASLIPEGDACPSCGGPMPVGEDGTYTGEVYTCVECMELVCEVCNYSPLLVLMGGDAPEYIVKYFADKGYVYDSGKSPDRQDNKLYDTYCGKCLSDIEVDYIKSIPAQDLLLHTSDQWMWPDGKQLFKDRLSKGE